MNMTQTRKEIESDYIVDSHGVIRSPGKFEGEMVYAPYFASLYGEGEMIGTEEGDNSELFEIDQDDRDTFPEIASDTVAMLTWEDGQGFFYAKELDSAELANLRAQIEGY